MHPRSVTATAVAVVGLILAVAACGGTSSPGPGRPGVTPTGTGTPSPAATADAHGWHAEASVRGGTVAVTLAVPGPLEVEGGCVPSLTVWLEDAAGHTAVPSPSGGAHCLALAIIDVPAGTTHTFSAETSVPAAHGRYTVHGLLLVSLPPGVGARVRENLPVLTLDL